MPGARKVRVYQDKKKSPNWYVEWRDSEGRRRTESAGPARTDAEARTEQLREQLRAARLGAMNFPASDSEQPSSRTARNVATNLLRLRAKINCGYSEVPFEINVELTPVLIEALRQFLTSVSGE